MKAQKAKLKEFQKYLRDKKIDLAFFYNLHLQEFDPNFYYFSDYEGIGFLVVSSRKKPFLIVPEMEAQRAKEQAAVTVIVAKKRLSEVLKKKIGNAKKIGLDKNGMTLAFFERFRKEMTGKKFLDVGKVCQSLRATKTKEEIKRITKACKITDNIFSKTFINFKQFKTESDVSSFMIQEANKLGLTVSFKPIIASGANASEPHHGSASRKLRKGFCVIDYGLRYKGYCSDMTRTIYLGKPTQKDLEIYELVLRTQLKAINSVKSGGMCAKTDSLVRKELGKHAKYFIHGLGHGIGLEIHEAPSVAKVEKEQFKEGMVHTIEPGVYIPKKLGIRIEDDLLVTKKSTKVLTKTGKNLLIIR